MVLGHRIAQVYIHDEEGSATVWSLFWTLIFLFLAGLAIDTSNAYRYKAALQATADASSVGAIMGFMRERTYQDFTGDSTTQAQAYRGTAVASSLAAFNMTTSRNGTVLPNSNIEYGRFAPNTGFVAGATPVNAARVQAIRTGNNSNELPTLFLDRFGLLASWDVGATSVAQAFFRGCPGREHIMAGNILQIASNNDFTGDLCMHGENGVDLNNGNEFFANLDGEIPGISFGLDGAMCSGFGNCQTEGFTNVIPGNINLTESMIQPGALVMPDVAAMIDDIYDVLGNPNLYIGESNGSNHLIPPSLVSNPDRSLGTLAILEGPDNGAALPSGWTSSFSGPVQIVDVSATAFEAVVNSGTALPNNTIYNVTTGCDTGNRRLELEGASVVLQDIVIRTSCRVLFDDNITFQGSTLYTDYNGGSSAIHGSAGVQLGGGTCADGSLGSHIISAVQDIDFAAGLAINNSHIISGADVDIAAQPNGMEGASILAANDLRLTSNGEWQGCPRNDDANRLEAYAYRIVQ